MTENNFIRQYEFEKNIAVIMCAYFQEFGERLTMDRYKRMIDDYYAEGNHGDNDTASA